MSACLGNGNSESGCTQIITRSAMILKVIVNRNIRKEIVGKQLSEKPENLKSLQMQGIFIAIDHADYLFS